MMDKIQCTYSIYTAQDMLSVPTVRYNTVLCSTESVGQYIRFSTAGTVHLMTKRTAAHYMQCITAVEISIACYSLTLALLGGGAGTNTCQYEVRHDRQGT